MYIMKIRRKVNITLIMSFFFVFTVKAQNIIKISYCTGGMGGYEKAYITKDSIIGEYMHRENELWKKIPFKVKTSKKFWKFLVKSITINDLKAVEKNKKEFVYDDDSTVISIETKQQKYTLREGNKIDGIKNKKVYHFEKKIKEELNKYTGLNWFNP